MYRIAKAEKFTDQTFLWEVDAPDVARAAQPGHFVMLRLDDAGERIPLTVADFEQILTATDACLVRQYEALLRTENVELEFRPDAIRRIAEIAHAVNEKQENIGARRLYTVMERLLEEISYTASHRDRETIAVDAAYVDTRLSGIVGDDNLAKYIL